MGVLSIQSSVSLGHVGNAAAVLPLQRLGHEVWPVDTVRFSNHPGHGSWRGEVLEPAAIAAVLKGIEERGAFTDCSAVLSGYLGSAETGRVVAATVARVKASTASTVYCCDPVIGDTAEGLYAPEDLARLFADELVLLADIAVPNAFELAFITGRTVNDLETALIAIDDLRARGPDCVVATSIPMADGLATLAVDGVGAWMVETPIIETPAKGSGDVLTALFLGHRLNGLATEDALSRAVSSVHAVLSATTAIGGDELTLVAAQDALVTPENLFDPRRIR